MTEGELNIYILLVINIKFSTQLNTYFCKYMSPVMRLSALRASSDRGIKGIIYMIRVGKSVVQG